MVQISSWKINRFKTGLITLLTLLAIFYSASFARADDTDILTDPPLVQQVNGLIVQFLGPAPGLAVGDKANFHFRVTNSSGTALEGLTLDLTAIEIVPPITTFI